MLHESRIVRLLAVIVVAVGLVATACGGSEESGSSADDGSSTTSGAAGPAAPSNADIEALTAKVAGGGASFPDAFYQAVDADFNGVAGSELVTYAKSGSSDGRKQLSSGTLDVAGSDSLPKPEETFPSQVLFFPTVAAPITVSYNLAGVDDLRLSADTVAGIFGGRITSWDDPAIEADNPDATLPATKITVVHRSDGSGTTNNFTKYLTAAAPDTWTLGSGDTVNWPAATQGAEKNSGVAALIGQTDGSVGYVDLADAIKADLTFASIKNAAGSFVAPSAAATEAAVANADVAEDLTYNPLNAPGADSYPITAPTYLLVTRTQSDAARAATLKTYLRYLLTTGQAQARKLGFVGLPDDLRQKAYDQVEEIGG